MPIPPTELVARAKARIRTLSCQEAAERLAGEPGLLLLDVREPDEHARAAVPGATNIPRGVLEFRIGQVAPDDDHPMLVHCASGGRAALATATLQDMGYRNVACIDGAFDELAACCAGLGKKA